MLFGAALQGLRVSAGQDSLIYSHCLWIKMSMRCTSESLSDRYEIHEAAVEPFEVCRAWHRDQPPGFVELFDTKQRSILECRRHPTSSTEAMVLVSSDRPPMTQIISMKVGRELLVPGKVKEISDWRERLKVFTSMGYAPSDMHTLSYPPGLLLAAFKQTRQLPQS